jgi:hypothetical protein
MLIATNETITAAKIANTLRAARGERRAKLECWTESDMGIAKSVARKKLALQV